jgi:hypothetical protein
MDVGAVSNGRAAFEAVRHRRPEPEPRPILVARIGLAPIREAGESELLQEDLLRSGLRHRSTLHDLEAVLSRPGETASSGAPGNPAIRSAQ